MHDALVQSFHALIAVSWLEIIKALAPAGTTVIAFLALRNWQRQDKAKRQAEFLDDLVDTVHSFVTEIARPVALVRVVRIGMMSHSTKWDDDDETEAVSEGAVTYIRKDGERDAKLLFEALNEVRPTTIRLRSLSTKGQIFRFDNYNRLQNSAAMLLWQFDRIEGFASMISSSTLNWEHPDVQRSLRGVLTVEPADIKKHLAEHNIAVLEFAQAIYKRIYG